MDDVWSVYKWYIDLGLNRYVKEIPDEGLKLIILDTT